MKIVSRSTRIFLNSQKVFVSGLIKINRRNYAQSSGLSYIHNIGKQPLVYRTIGQQLTRAANEFGDRGAVVCIEERTKFTYEQLRSEADRLAAGFQCLGLTRGDRVGIWAPNVAIWPVVMFAAARAGLILVALNPAYEAPEMQFCIQKVGIKALVASESFRQTDYYEKLVKLSQNSAQVILEGFTARSYLISRPSLSTLNDTFRTFRLSDVGSLPTPSQISSIEDQQKDISPDSGCNIQFTSGTTGMPKATILKHLAFINNALAYRKLGMERRKACILVPFFHAYGLMMGIMNTMCNNLTLVVPSIHYNAQKNFSVIRDEECSVIYGTPTMYVDLINKQREMNLKLNAEIAITGGAPCTPQLIKEMKEGLGIKKIKTFLGMTENTGVSFLSLPEDPDERAFDGVGHIQDHIEAKVVDAQGNLVPFGTPGELCVRGYFTMLGYWGDEEKTRETLGRDGWLRTGDQFILQSDGYGKVVGRLKEMIIRGGENIFPKEIENFLATCPQIAEAYIVGVPDERLGEEMCAFVRLRSDCESFSPQDIRDFCKGKITYFKIPKYIEIVTEFPKTVSGKIQKFKLQEEFVDISRRIRVSA